MNRDESGGCGRKHVVVDSIADVRDLSRRAARLGDDSGKEPGRRFLHAPARRRADDVDEPREHGLHLGARVAHRAEEVPGRAELSEGAARIRIEVLNAESRRVGPLDSEQLVDTRVRLAPRGRWSATR